MQHVKVTYRMLMPNSINCKHHTMLSIYLTKNTNTMTAALW